MIIQAECLSHMKTMDPNSISAIVTDPPYGLQFMGKEWDHGVPGMEFWKEALRISKPGSWLLSFGGTRTYHRLTCAIEGAGWEIRDCIMWIYGSGFPKGKGCLKPAYEPIILARKPGCKVSDNFLNIDECRIGTDDTRGPASKNSLGIMNDDGWECNPNLIVGSSCGRWPANVILDEKAAQLLDDQTGILKSGSIKGSRLKTNPGLYGHGREFGNVNDFPSSSGGASRFFYCAKAPPSERNDGLDGLPLKDAGIKNDSGRGFSESDPMKVIQYKNNHPCVKPIKLMEYLIKLVMPSGGILLDPFAGSGTTILAAKRLGFDAIGIEMNEEYCDIARNRLDALKK